MGKYAQELDEKGGEYLERMQNAAYRMQNLIRDFLMLSKKVNYLTTYILDISEKECREVPWNLPTRV